MHCRSSVVSGFVLYQVLPVNDFSLQEGAASTALLMEYDCSNSKRKKLRQTGAPHHSVSVFSLITSFRRRESNQSKAKHHPLGPRLTSSGPKMAAAVPLTSQETSQCSSTCWLVYLQTKLRSKTVLDPLAGAKTREVEQTAT